MAIKSEAQSKAVTRYISKHYDQLVVRVPKGKREEYQEKIKELGYDSVNCFIVDAIEEKISRKEHK